ncbi:type IV toxin-antitoxin system AbiEi family antitoxin domain-containing protein [Arthrobacter sp. VKM Ac-2550]|uniref:type IV toxin-antitoxin system AbiEi family antitoxin domain-containing protein n=1 Tax=Crystallibacter permensis TaxID=1938888 RepID=UPI002227545E|nr:type IV toxin-antitoxin system AbiEi family antitoxin domain-containing protein [Arthrobacter sp. VKM Ac-2550]
MDRDLLKMKALDVWPSSLVATTAQLADLGLSTAFLAAAVRNNVLVRIRRGAYIPLDVWRDSLPDQRDLFRIQAHLLAARHGGTYSHVTAARLHGLHTWGVSSEVHVTLDFSWTRSSQSRDTLAHTLKLDPDQVTWIEGPGGNLFPVTTLERTVVDCARTLNLHQAAVIGDHALHRGASLTGMRELVHAHAGKRGIKKAGRVLSLLDGRSESPGETRTRLLLGTFGIPMPEPQFRVSTRHGDHRLDFAWKDIMLALEFDGRIKYFDYGPTDQVLLEERKRENALTEIHWNFCRVYWPDFSDPEGLKARLINAMKLASARTAALQQAR